MVFTAEIWVSESIKDGPSLPPTTPTTNHAISPVGTSRFLPVEKASCDQVLKALSNLYFSLDESQQVPGDSSHSTCLHSDQWSFNSYYPLFLVSMNKTCWPKNRLPQTGNGKAAVRRWVWSFWRGNLGWHPAVGSRRPKDGCASRWRLSPVTCTPLTLTPTFQNTGRSVSRGTLKCRKNSINEQELKDPERLSHAQHPIKCSLCILLSPPGWHIWHEQLSSSLEKWRKCHEDVLKLPHGLLTRLWQQHGSIKPNDGTPDSGEGSSYPLQYSGLENSRDRGAWWVTVRGVAKSQTHFLSNS